MREEEALMKGVSSRARKILGELSFQEVAQAMWAFAKGGHGKFAQRFSAKT